MGYTLVHLWACELVFKVENSKAFQECVTKKGNRNKLVPIKEKSAVFTTNYSYSDQFCRGNIKLQKDQKLTFWLIKHFGYTL